MNIHHLELFYYVARHGGISRAVRNMPYGIQQPAVSSQILQLEQDLGVKLFERTPFRLSTAGEELYAFVGPFFENLKSVKERLGRKAGAHLRLAASEVALREHLPAVIEELRRQAPELRLSLRSGFQPQMETWLIDREIDLAITPLESRPPAQLRCLRLLRVPLVLLVPKRAKLKSAAELWTRELIDEPLICLPPDEVVTRIFQRNLKKRRVNWPVAIEASSLELITQYVAGGFGYGISLDLPSLARHRAVRALPLVGFESLETVALWRGEPSPLVRSVLEAAQRYVAKVWPDWATPAKQA